MELSNLIKKYNQNKEASKQIEAKVMSIFLYDTNSITNPNLSTRDFIKSQTSQFKIIYNFKDKPDVKISWLISIKSQESKI